MVKLDAKKDPAVIPFGRFARDGLDELPQLINVLRGEMSIVGPRPCVPYEYDLYGPERRRFEATPGLTGLWQVSGKNRTTFNEMIDLDIEYAERIEPVARPRDYLQNGACIVGSVHGYAGARRRQKAAPSPIPNSIQSFQPMKQRTKQ